MITTEHWYIPSLKWAQKCRIVFSQYETNRCFFYIPFPERHTDSDTLTEKLDHVWSCLHTLSKPWENFMFSTISSIRNMSQHKAQFTHLFVTNLTFIFMWVQLVKNQLKIWKKLWPLTIDHFGDNEDSISFFIFSYSEIWSPPNLPLPHK